MNESKLSIVLTVTIDSYFRNYSAQNLFLSQHSAREWNVSIFHEPFLFEGQIKSSVAGFTSITSYLPKLLGSLPLSFIGLLPNSCIQLLLLAPLIFIGLISCLGPKEWQFIIYIVPTFNIADA